MGPGGSRPLRTRIFENARSCYLRWGADGKVRQIDLENPHFVQQLASPGSGNTIGAPIEQLDLATVVRVSQVVTGEIDFNKLIDVLMKTALEHAGGERGLLILPPGPGDWIEAEAALAPDTTVVRRPNERVSASKLAESVFLYVMRTRESLLLDDASRQEPFAADEYVRLNNCRSILCLPLIKQAQLMECCTWRTASPLMCSLPPAMQC